jgi:hypothetical protein
MPSPAAPEEEEEEEEKSPPRPPPPTPPYLVEMLERMRSLPPPRSPLMGGQLVEVTGQSLPGQLVEVTNPQLVEVPIPLAEGHKEEWGTVSAVPQGAPHPNFVSSAAEWRVVAGGPPGFVHTFLLPP